MLAADTEFILYSLGYGFSQRRISLGNAVLESGGGVVFVYVSGKSSKVVGREGQRGGFPAAKLIIVGSERDLKISRIADGLSAASLFEILYSICFNILLIMLYSLIRYFTI